MDAVAKRVPQGFTIVPVDALTYDQRSPSVYLPAEGRAKRVPGGAAGAVEVRVTSPKQSLEP